MSETFVALGKRRRERVLLRESIVVNNPDPLNNERQNPNIEFLVAYLQIATERSAKGDKAFRAKNYRLARSKYEAAYNTLQTADDALRYTLWSESCDTASKALTMDILPKLTETSLELDDFDNVHRWADDIIALKPHFLRDDTNPLFNGSTLYSANVFHLAYYCKAVAYQKEGRPNAGYLAMRNFEHALACDGGSHATYYQLEALKETHKAKKLIREARDEKVRQERELVRSQHERQLRKKMAKEAKTWAKMARGSGYLVGVGV